MRVLFIVLAQMFFCTLAIFCLIQGFELVGQGNILLALVCVPFFLVGVVGFAFFTRAYQAEL